MGRPTEAEEPEDAVAVDEDGDEEVRARDLRFMAGFLGPFVGPYRVPFSALGLTLLVETLFNISFPLATQYLVDEGLLRRDRRVLVGVLAFLAVAAGIVAAAGLACDYLASRIFSRIVRDVRQRLFDHLQTLSIRYFTGTQAGGILSRFSGDMAAVEAALVSLIPWLVLPLLEVAYSTILMFVFDVRLALIGSLIFPLTLLGPRWLAGRAFALSYEKRRSEARLLSAVQENVSAQPVVKAFGLQGRARADFRDRGGSWVRLASRVNFLGALAERTAYTGVYLIHLAVFGLGAYWVFTDRMSLGTLVAFEGMFLSMGYALAYVAQFVPTLAQAAGSMRHLDELLAEGPEVVDAPRAVPCPRLRRGIALERVGFAYPGGSFRLCDVDVAIPRGSYLAFVGPSGSGKSTVLHLLMRFYDPDRGRVSFDGLDARAVTQDSLRSQIGVVFQENTLFHATIEENIRLGDPAATAGQVERPPKRPRSTSSSDPCRRATGPSSASAGAGSREASGSGSPSPGPWSGTRRSCCSTRRPARWITPRRRPSRPPSASSRAGGRSSTSPTDSGASETPTASCASTAAGSSRKGRTTS
jgi:ATP-binding cassette subfamily B protein